jgi:hypothetical protein
LCNIGTILKNILVNVYIYIYIYILIIKWVWCNFNTKCFHHLDKEPPLLIKLADILDFKI